MNCHRCGNNTTVHVIYYGLPALFCTYDNCSLMSGWSGLLTRYLPFNGVLYVYDPGRYWSSLYEWLTGDYDD